MARTNPYYYINDIGEIKPDVDNGSKTDKARKLIGNYFYSTDEARKKLNGFHSLFGFKPNLINRLRLSKYLP